MLSARLGAHEIDRAAVVRAPAPRCDPEPRAFPGERDDVIREGPGAAGEVIFTSGDMKALAREAMSAVGVSRGRTLADGTEADTEARRFVASRIETVGGGVDG